MFIEARRETTPCPPSGRPALRQEGHVYRGETRTDVLPSVRRAMFIEARREPTPCPRLGGLRYLSGPNNIADMALLTEGGNVSSVCL